MKCKNKLTKVLEINLVTRLQVFGKKNLNYNTKSNTLKRWTPVLLQNNLTIMKRK